MKTKSVIQYLGKEINTIELEKKAKKQWVAKGGLVKDISNLSLYIKPEDSKCYFIINENFKGDIAL
jgi:hypothetical protein